MKLAKIIPIRPEIQLMPVNCAECRHGYLGESGVLCEITRDFVFDESIAASCEAFEREANA